MFWIALSGLIMALTGTGDDTAAYRTYVESLKEAVAEAVPDEARRASASATLDEWYETFRAHREGLGKAGDCLDAADRAYDSTQDDYAHCLDGMDEHWEMMAERMLKDRRKLREQLKPEEMAKLEKGGNE
jgi:hypothetical protein